MRLASLQGAAVVVFAEVGHAAERADGRAGGRA